MAKGFVEQVKGSTAEEVADSYLVELTFRNMLQVVERNEFGRPKRCKMHEFGVVHDGGEEMKECNARLSLTNAYVGKQLCFSTGFLKLTSLRIRNFPQLNETIIEKGVMPNLKSLDIISCMELNTVPVGIE